MRAASMQVLVNHADRLVAKKILDFMVIGIFACTTLMGLRTAFDLQPVVGIQHHHGAR